MANNIELSEYEIIRQQNIEKNKELLRSLGLAESKQQFRQSTIHKDTAEKIKRKYTKRKFIIHELRRSSRKQGKPVRYTDDFLEHIETMEGPPVERISTITLFGGYKPKYKNEITTCHYCYVRNRKPKTKCSQCNDMYWRGQCCRRCFETHFEEDFDEVLRDDKWVCFVCKGVCTCGDCLAGITHKGKRYGPREKKDDETLDLLNSSTGSQQLPELLYPQPSSSSSSQEIPTLPPIAQVLEGKAPIDPNNIPLAPLSANFAQIMSSFAAPSTEQIIPQKKKGRKPRSSSLPTTLDLELYPVLPDQDQEQDEEDDQEDDEMSRAVYAQVAPNGMMVKRRGRKPKKDAMGPPKKRGRKPKKVNRLPKIKFVLRNGIGKVSQQDPTTSILAEKPLPKKRGRKPRQSLDQEGDEQQQALHADGMMNTFNMGEGGRAIVEDLPIPLSAPVPANPLSLPHPMPVLGFDTTTENVLKFDPVSDASSIMRVPGENLMDLFQNESLRDMFHLENPPSIDMMSARATTNGTNTSSLPPMSTLPPAMTSLPSSMSSLPSAMSSATAATSDDIINGSQTRISPDLPRYEDFDDYDAMQLGLYGMDRRRGRKPKVGSLRAKRKSEDEKLYSAKKPRLSDKELANIRKSPRATKTKVFLDHVTF